MRYTKFILVPALIVAFSPAFATLKPDRTYKHTPKEFGVPFDEMQVKTSDGAQIHTWYIPAPKPSKKTVIIASGGEGNMSYNLDKVNNFFSIGYNVVLFDYRGYGESSDFEIDSNIYIYPQFVMDLESVIDYVKKNYTALLDLYGLDIGAGISLGVAASRIDIRHVIADGPWLSLETIRTRYKEVRNEDITIPFGYNKQKEPLYALEVKSINVVGILLIVGSKDEMMTKSDMNKLKALQSSKTDIYVVNGVANAQNYNTEPNKYFEAIKEFLTAKQ